MPELPYREGTRAFTGYLADDRLLDLYPEDTKPVKWWLVKAAARILGVAPIETIWSGPAMDFRVECLPNVPQPPDTQLAIRQYSRGPWITL
jgi:hypothetical protein